MNKILIIALLIGVALLPGCLEKKWWEDCYESEEAAMLDQLNAEIADLRQEIKDARYYRY